MSEASPHEAVGIRPAKPRKILVSPHAQRRGRMGTVYRGAVIEKAGPRQVAIEVPDVPIGPQLLAFLRGQVGVLDPVVHPALVRTEPFALLNGRWTVIREHVDAIDLQTLLNEGPISPGPALDVVGQLAAILASVAASRGEAPSPDDGDMRSRDVLVTAAGVVRVIDVAVPDNVEACVHDLGRLLHALLTTRDLDDLRLQPEAHEAQRKRAMDAVWDVLPDIELTEFVGQTLHLDVVARPSLIDVERQCSRLREELGLEDVATWARKRIAPLLAALPDFDPDDGTVIAERLDEPVRTPTPVGTTIFAESPRRKQRKSTLQGFEESPTDRLPGGSSLPSLTLGDEGTSPVSKPDRRLLVGAGVAVLLVLLVVAGVALRGDPTPEVPEPAHEELPGAADVTPPLPDPVPVPPIEVAPTPPADPVPEAPPQAASALEPSEPAVEATVAPEPTPEPVAPSGASVQLAGDAVMVVLQAGDLRIALPGEVPAGEYAIVATFEGLEPTVAGQLVLTDGSVTKVRCNGLFARCSAD